MMSDNKVSYTCYLPKEVQSPYTETPEIDVNKQKERAIKILRQFQNLCFYRVRKKRFTKQKKITGWWIYEFCFNKHVRQYHQEKENKITAEFFLGYRKDDNYEIVLDKSTPEESYVEITFKDGTVCDLTKQPRKIQVRFYCPKNAKEEFEGMQHFIAAVDEYEFLKINP